jgi:hypothetical protein
VETVRDFEFSLNREGCPGSPYTHLISSHCGISLFLKERAADLVAWGEENLSFQLR